MRRQWRAATVVMASAAAAGCSDGGPPAAICDPLDDVVPAAVGMPEDPTLGDAIVHADRVARDELVLVAVFLEPDAVDDLAALADAASALAASDRDVEVLDQEAAYKEYVELFADEAPELVGAVTPTDLPTVVRVVANDPDAADELLTEIEALDVVRVFDSREEHDWIGRTPSLRSSAGLAALDALVAQADDADVADAADVLVAETELFPSSNDDLLSPGELREALDERRAVVAEALTTLAVAVEACG